MSIRPPMKITFLLSLFFAGVASYAQSVIDKEAIAFVQWDLEQLPRHGIEPKHRRRQLFYKPYNWYSKADSIAKIPYIKEVVIQMITNPWGLGRNGRARLQLDSLFNENDFIYLHKQLVSLDFSTVWLKDDFIVKVRNTINNKFPNIYLYSIPLFSVNRKRVIVKREYYCGNVCAEGEILIYEKVDGTGWELRYVLSRWIS